ncbi:MAG: hypothetical protein QXK29_05060 [Candidatus Bathyarchaeia archaeon]
MPGLSSIGRLIRELPRMARDLTVAKIDLGVARLSPVELNELTPAVSLTIFRLTGTMELYLQKADENRKIAFEPIAYPQTFLIDWFRVEHVYIANVAQPGKEAVIIAWKS